MSLSLAIPRYNQARVQHAFSVTATALAAEGRPAEAMVAFALHQLLLLCHNSSIVLLCTQDVHIVRQLIS